MVPVKSEAMFFHDGTGGAPPQASVKADEVSIPVGPNLKYLGLTLYGRWSFVDHFDNIAPRLGRRADALLGLMPNLRGPNDGVRRAYMYAVLSGAYYGASVWSEEALASRHIRQKLQSVQRRLVLRIARAYRTVSHDVLAVLAGVLPAERVADALAKSRSLDSGPPRGA
ncbi:uncharacterized protein [Mycetomoellerius zeteki]|uniref:uncharacterized protein n=1 Tax=Mycetomoellerius zeteki TaxID=64791 RepID=UPI00084E847E|nr:PREDICTED: uncharacterized protein LOC108727762 [Trachymyrmex zeteki]